MSANQIKVFRGETELVGASKTSLVQEPVISWNEITILGVSLVRTGDLDGSENIEVVFYEAKTPGNVVRTDLGVVARRVYAMTTDRLAFPAQRFVAGSDIAADGTASRRQEYIEYEDEAGNLTNANCYFIIYNPSAKAQKYGYTMRYRRRA